MTMTLAQDIVTALWKDGCLKGSDDKWHRESLDEYQARLIDIVQGTITVSRNLDLLKEIADASQGPNEDTTKPKGSSEVGGVFALPKHMLNRRFSKSEASDQSGRVDGITPEFLHPRGDNIKRSSSDSTAPNHDGDDRMGTDMGTLPCS